MVIIFIFMLYMLCPYSLHIFSSSNHQNLNIFYCNSQSFFYSLSSVILFQSQLYLCQVILPFRTFVLSLNILFFSFLKIYIQYDLYLYSCMLQVYFFFASNVSKCLLYIYYVSSAYFSEYFPQIHSHTFHPVVCSLS